jgi:hypothetical protein
VPICPKCNKDINEIFYWQSGQIELGGNIKRDGWWYMQDPERNFQCPERYIPLGPADLDKLGVPEDMR